MNETPAILDKFSESLVHFQSRRLVLKQMVEEDITDTYLAWLNDLEVTRFLEVRFSPPSLEDLVAYVRRCLDPESRTLHLGVFDERGSRLVGTLTFNQVDRHHRTACISFVIGHPEANGRGYATEAVHAGSDFMFRKCAFVKLYGGYYAGHEASAKVFRNNGYRMEGRLRDQLLNYKEERVDHILVGLLVDEFVPDPRLLEMPG
jgi:RimJ/RimL family protein N-acetyltransferase